MRCPYQGHGPLGADPSYSRQRMAIRWRDERALVRGAQGGAQAALEELFRLHWGRAHRAAYLVVLATPSSGLLDDTAIVTSAVG